jgi:ParB/RepB/Spo0J family partition protein
MSKSATLEVISISQIDVSKTNPRKSFDEKALKELSESIKEHGILQPVLVRPINSSLDEPWEQFELVCGERRYRAAKLAGLEEIPVNIRVLTDDEAFELQIIENLERKDVHPLDEADAFKKMLDSGKYTVTDIAAKMAKPESFIVQRLKLVDLIDDVRKDFLAGHFGIGHAILIARCDEYQQLDIYKNAQPFNGKEPINYGTIHELKETIEDDSYLLTDAKFDLSDTNLISDTCACDVCPKRSGANPLLFSDMQEDRCFDKNCYDDKHEAFIEKEVAKIINEGKNTPILLGYSKPNEMVITICKEYGIKILENYKDFSEYHREDWNLVTGFYASGSRSGKYEEVYIKPIEESKEETESEAYSSTGSKAPISNEVRELKEEISKIESRQTRSIELDGEKVWAAIRAIDTSEIKTIIGGLFDVEIDAVCLAMISKLGYYGNVEVQKIVGKFDLETIQNRHFTKFEHNQIQRIFFLESLPTAFGNYYGSVYNYAYTKALIHYNEEEIQDLIDKQKEISDIRLDKLDAKIKEVKAKIEDLKPTVIPAAEIETSSEEVVVEKTAKRKMNRKA